MGAFTSVTQLSNELGTHERRAVVTAVGPASYDAGGSVIDLSSLAGVKVFQAADLDADAGLGVRVGGGRAHGRGQPTSLRKGRTRLARSGRSRRRSSSYWMASATSYLPEARRRRVARWAPQPSLAPRSWARERT